MRCDVIVPVHNQPHWLLLCLEELYRCTPPESLGKVLLIDDASDDRTKTVIGQCQSEHRNLSVITHEKNLGYARSVNDGIKHSTADYVFLLNTDCLLTPLAIPKLATHCERDPQIGLISPFSNNSEPLTFPMFHGYSYRKMNDLFMQVFPGLSMETCTIVGNALMITARCLAEVGAFDVSYGRGYGEETDYQFRAMARGFKCVAALDTYVYHRGGETFGEDPAANALRVHNHDAFMKRWGSTFDEFSRRVPPDSPKRRIAELLEKVDLSPCTADAMFVMASLGQTVGGCHAVVDICNMAARLGVDIQLAIVNGQTIFDEPMLFRPIIFKTEREFIDQTHFKPRCVIATLWITVFVCRQFVDKHNIPLVYFVQGYEFFFDSGINYRGVEESFRNVDHVLTSSRFLRQMLEHHTSAPITILPIGYDGRCFSPAGRRTSDKVRVCVSLRGSLDKGQPFLMEFLHRLASLHRRVEVNVITRDAIDLPTRVEAMCSVYRLPLRRTKLADVFRASDIFVDASLHEGWALSPLEALACGCTIITSYSGGVADYAVDGHNATIINEVNRPERYFDEVVRLVKHRARLISLCQEAPDSVRRFDGDAANGAYCRTITRLVRALSERKRAQVAKERARIPAGAPPAPGVYDYSRSMSPALAVAGEQEGPTAARFPSPPAALVRIESAVTEERLARIENAVTDIYMSRIWRVLCAGGEILSFLFRWRRSQVKVS